MLCPGVTAFFHSLLKDSVVSAALVPVLICNGLIIGKVKTFFSVLKDHFFYILFYEYSLHFLCFSSVLAVRIFKKLIRGSLVLIKNMSWKDPFPYDVIYYFIKKMWNFISFGIEVIHVFFHLWGFWVILWRAFYGGGGWGGSVGEGTSLCKPSDPGSIPRTDSPCWCLTSACLVPRVFPSHREQINVNSYKRKAFFIPRRHGLLAALFVTFQSLECIPEED